MPNISTAKPISAEAMVCFEPPFFLCTSFITRPATAAMLASDAGFKSSRKILPEPIPESPSSHDVAVVPTFEPIITPTAPLRLMIPLFTKPTVITVTADDD